MTLRLKPGHKLSDEELLELERRLQAEYPGENLTIVIEDAPAPRTRPAEPPGVFKSLVVGFVTAVAALYLINPTLGVLELIPDNLPLIGNLDEAGAVLLLTSGLTYFGFNMDWFTAVFGPGAGKSKRG